MPKLTWRLAQELGQDGAHDLDEWRPPLRQLLFNRGLTIAEQVEEFLFPEKIGLLDPFTMRGMDAAVERIFRALREETRIAIYADFDVDGLTGGALLLELLESPAFEGHAEVYLPHRVLEGYGLNAASIRTLAARDVGLLITVDCGTSSASEIKLAQELGMDVIVTDHHQVTTELPPAVAVLNPRQDGCGYPNRNLAGVGVAYKLAEALLSRVWGLEEARRRLVGSLDLVALGTVADLAMLTGENRLLVRQGLVQLNEGARPGLRALRAVAGFDGRKLDSESIAYTFGPRLNAAGRMGDARRGLDLLTCQSEAEAAALALELESANRDRQMATSAALALARQEMSAMEDVPPALVLAGDYPSGVAGLIASRLAEEYRRPTFVIERGPVESRGSARGVPGFDVVAALGASADLLARFGGHSQAGGFALHTKLLPVFKERIESAAVEQLGEESLDRELYLEAVLRLAEIGQPLFRDLELLEPCGNGNRRPVFCSQRVQIRESRTVGNGHLKLWLYDESGMCSAIGFGMATEEYSFARPGEFVDCAFSVARNERAGTVGYEMVLKDLRPWRALP